MTETSAHWISLPGTAGPGVPAVAMAVFLLVILGCLAVLAYLSFLRRPARGGCDWRSEGAASENLQCYRCALCGVEAYTATGGPPVDCKRNLRSRPL